MKIHFLLALLVVFSACNNYKDEVVRLQNQNDSLVIITQQKDQKVIEYVKAFNDIQMNLDEIKKAQNIIDMTLPDVSSGDSSAELRILEDINLINDLMIDNRKKIQVLEKSLTSSGAKSKELQKLLEYMQQQVENKDAEIARLSVKLEEMHIEVASLTSTIDTLNLEIEEQTKIIEEQAMELNKAFLVIGREKELIACNILTKEGGFIGIGKISKLKTNFDDKCFRKININDVKTITLNAKKAKVLTPHPTDSYKIGGLNGAEKLEILDNKAFWSVSKYMVVVIE